MERVLNYIKCQYPVCVFIENVKELYEYAINDLHILLANNKVFKIQSINRKTSVYALNLKDNVSDNAKKLWLSL